MHCLSSPNVNKLHAALGAVALLALLDVAHADPGAANCELLAKLTLRKTTVTLAQATLAGELKETPSVPSALVAQMPAFCRVAATLKPSNDSDIKIEVWLPNDWNGRLQSVGNGGLAGSISYAAM